ncbi:hypothetical protein MPLA_680060 [Mesorhizobium sp. ORS 3359]|nr:hypothetical protein MPLA_680060 [Mesorhizobium sp. ORS 3359]
MVCSITSQVDPAFVPAIRSSSLLANSATNFRTEARSSAVIALYSPVEPQGTQPDTPSARSLVSSFSNALKSIFPVASNGVTKAGITPFSFIIFSFVFVDRTVQTASFWRMRLSITVTALVSGNAMTK